MDIKALLYWVEFEYTWFRSASGGSLSVAASRAAAVQNVCDKRAQFRCERLRAERHAASLSA